MVSMFGTRLMSGMGNYTGSKGCEVAAKSPELGARMEPGDGRCIDGPCIDALSRLWQITTDNYNFIIFDSCFKHRSTIRAIAHTLTGRRFSFISQYI